MEWVGLVEAVDQITAESWCTLLESEGISAFPKTTSSGGYVNILFGPTRPIGCWVMVREDDVDKATAILRPILEGKRHLRRRKRFRGKETST
jgi:hypothetical protein